VEPVDPEARSGVAAIAALAGVRMTAAGDELDLLARLGRGDRDAVDRLYARYARPLYGYVLDLVPDAGLAEEVVQDTFVAAWRGASRFEGRSSLASWLFGIARRQARDRTRSRRPQPEPDDRLHGLADPAGGPEAMAIESATRAELIAALDALPDHHREPLVLAFAYELSGAEIAAVLDIPAGTVKSRLHAARRALRLILEARVETGAHP
jgi:RNA polymerase sigma factor (sigma-70 family)